MNAIFRRREPRTEHLGARQTFRLKGGRGLRLRCLEGVCWITREGDPRDYVIRAGEEVCAAGPGRLAVWAITAARLRVEAEETDRRWFLRPLVSARPSLP